MITWVRRFPPALRVCGFPQVWIGGSRQAHKLNLAAAGHLLDGRFHPGLDFSMSLSAKEYPPFGDVLVFEWLDACPIQKFVLVGSIFECLDCSLFIGCIDYPDFH